MDKKRKLMIVIEDTGTDGGKDFQVYLTGDKERINKVPDDQLSPAEYYGAKLFQIVVNTLKEVDVIKTEEDLSRH